MNILYVTSFTKKLYVASGKRMLKSFNDFNIEGDLLVTYEGFYDKFESMYSYNLDNDEWLKEWTEENKDFIPEKYGGICKKNENEWEDAELKYGCHFNYQAARFFRKVVSINHACKNFSSEYDIIIYADCDSIFTKQLPASLVENVLGDNAMFYHLGPFRHRQGAGIESGFIGWNLKNGGLEYLNHVFEIYRGSKFRKLKRWDDGYVFRVMVEKYPEIKCKDLVTFDGRYTGQVIIHGPFAKYFVHEKGRHQRSKIH